MNWYSTISIHPQRIGDVEYSKITSKAALAKYIEPTEQLRKFIEQKTGVRVKSLYVDYLLDLFDKVWLLNLKYI